VRIKKFSTFVHEHKSRTKLIRLFVKTNKMKKLVTTLCLLTIVVVAFAQPGNPNNPVPLDGGISLLIAAGAAFGAKKIYDIKKRD
jgi:hypothetical protein